MSRSEQIRFILVLWLQMTAILVGVTLVRRWNDNPWPWAAVLAAGCLAAFVVIGFVCVSAWNKRKAARDALVRRAVLQSPAALGPEPEKGSRAHSPRGGSPV